MGTSIVEVLCYMQDQISRTKDKGEAKKFRPFFCRMEEFMKLEEIVLVKEHLKENNELSFYRWMISCRFMLEEKRFAGHGWSDCISTGKDLVRG